MDTAETEKLHCNNCRGVRNHNLLNRVFSSGENEDNGIYWSSRYDTLQCLGCEDVVLRRVSVSSEDPNTTTYFPPPMSRWFPSWRWSLPSEIKSLLEEVYSALQADSSSVAMMGARALIESAMLSKVGDQGNFQRNLEAMEQGGFLSRTNRDFLEAALDAGSASIHRGHRPDKEQVSTVMDITENLLHSLFVLERATWNLRKTTPQRASKRATKE